ncbi:MAG: hypothetical protein ACK5KP_09690 [Paludibacteraceae bacterium]
MKNIKKSALIMPIVILSLSFLPMKTYARPFIGSETVTETSVNEYGCTVKTTIRRHYFLWIHYNSTLESSDIRC